MNTQKQARQVLTLWLTLGLALGLMLVLTVFGLGCAGPSLGSKSQTQVSVTSQEALFLAIPLIPDGVDSLVSQLGWERGRFAQELRQELRFQFNQKGIAIAQDSSGIKSSLTLIMKEYADGRGGHAHFSGEVLLKTSAGARQFAISHSSHRARALERADPTLDYIRKIAESIASEAIRSSKARKAPESRPARPSESNPPLLMIF